MTVGVYNGHREENPGKLQWRHKGFFKNLQRAKRYAARFKKTGVRAQVRKYVDGYSLYLMAKHDFWGNNFVYDICPVPR